jgi:pseudoazurin
LRRLLFSVSVFAFVMGVFGVNALPPGTNAEIRERLKPAGTVSRSIGEENATSVAAVPAIVQMEKVSLSAGSEHEVKMLNSGPGGTMIFEPAVIKVSIGDTVHFKATDLAHNSASVVGMVPDGAESWAGQMSQDISVTLNTEGVYVYQCDPHVVMAMVGVIQVGDAVNMTEIEESAENMKTSFAMNTQRLEQYLSAL